MTLPPAFFVGANLPWIRYGGDFGANAWAPAGLSQHPEPERIASLFETLRAHGVTTIRWFLLCDGRAGVRFGEDGFPDGLDDARLSRRGHGARVGRAGRSRRASRPARFSLVPADADGQRRAAGRASPRAGEAVGPAAADRVGAATAVRALCRRPARARLGPHQRAGMGHARRRHLERAAEHSADGDARLHPRGGALRAPARQCSQSPLAPRARVGCVW